MNSASPIWAAGWISTPVSVREKYAIPRGTAGTSAQCRACATRWISTACRPGQPVRISSVETPSAAGSRWRTAATSRRSSPDTRRIVVTPHIGYEGNSAAVRAIAAPAGVDAQDVQRREVDAQERVRQRAGRAGQELQRLQSL